MQDEIWKPIPGTRGYEASSEGRVRNRHGRVLKQCDNGIGYQIVGVTFIGHLNRSVTVHSMVALAFLGPRPDGYDIAHADHDKTNNRPENLRYATRQENLADGFVRRRFKFWDTIAPAETRAASKWTRPGILKQRAEFVGRQRNCVFEISGTSGKLFVTRRPMLDAMTCSATASVGGPA